MLDESVTWPSAVDHNLKSFALGICFPRWLFLIHTLYVHTPFPSLQFPEFWSQAHMAYHGLTRKVSHMIEISGSKQLASLCSDSVSQLLENGNMAYLSISIINSDKRIYFKVGEFQWILG